MKTPIPRAITPIARELLLVGGGHAHVAVLRHFGRAPVPGVRVTLLSRDTHTPYSGMLPGLVAGHYSHDDCHIDLRRLCEATGARLIRGTLTSIDTVSRTAEVAERGSLAWDMLSINTGSAPALDSIAGARDHGIALKPIDRFISAWEAFERSLTPAGSPRQVMVVGGGAAAAEMALALSWRLRQSDLVCRITLLAAGEQLLETHNAQVRRVLGGKLAAAGVDVRLGARVTAVTATRLELADGSQPGCDLAVWAIHAGAPSWTRTTGLACDAAGFLAVDSTLRSVSNDCVFAAGDIAALPVAVPTAETSAVPVVSSSLKCAVRPVEEGSFSQMPRMVVPLAVSFQLPPE
jgi:selenide,water dikinase